MKAAKILLKIILRFAAFFVVPALACYFLMLAIGVWMLDLSLNEALLRSLMVMVFILALGFIEAGILFVLGEIKDKPDSW